MNATLMRHQQDAVNFAVANGGRAAFFMEVGTGKTLSALATFAALREKDPRLKMLVICPLSLIHGAWVREIKKFTKYHWYDLHGGEKSTKFADIFIINFEYLISIGKHEGMIHLLKHNPGWLCVIDESSKMKNHKAKTTERIMQLKPYFNHRIVMSGTPAPNVEWEYFSQMFFVSETILGSDFYKFKNTHFCLRRGNQTAPGMFMNRAALRKMHEQGFKYEMIPAKRDAMFNRMKPWVFNVKAADCIDLPKEIDEFRVIEMTPRQKKAYQSMKDHYIAELSEENFTVANVILTKLMKLRQITSGFAINDKEQEIAIDEKNPKLNALIEIVEEFGLNPIADGWPEPPQMIIWCHFHWEIDTVVKALSEIAGVSQLHGRVPQAQRNDSLNKFLEGTNRFLVAHPASAAHGLTLTNCHISVFFSMDYSMEAYSQARGRTYRKGQVQNCIYFHILAKDTIDEDVLTIVQKKATMQEVADRYLKR